MIAALIFLVPLGMTGLFLFFHFSPKDQYKTQSIKRFNVLVIIINILSCAIYSYRTYLTMIGTTDRAWWPVLAVLGSLFIFSAILFLGTFIRFIIFKK